MQRGPVALVLHHDQLVAGSVQQGGYHIHMTHFSSKVQRCLGGLGSAAHLGLVLDQHLHKRQPACITGTAHALSVLCWRVGSVNRGALCPENRTLVAV